MLKGRTDIYLRLNLNAKSINHFGCKRIGDEKDKDL